MTQVAGWEMNIERGPDWLFVRPDGLPSDERGYDTLADEVWMLLEQHFSHRIVLELDGIETLPRTLVAQLALLRDRVCAHGGLIRVAGLSEKNRLVLQQCLADGQLPLYTDRTSAVMGERPVRPR